MTSGEASAAPPSGLLLVTGRLDPAPSGGRDLLTKLNHDALRELYGPRLAVQELSKDPVRGLAGAALAFRGHLDGVNGPSIRRVHETLSGGGVRTVFLDGSNLGEVARAVKARHPRVRVLTFFHNVEARFFLGAFKQRPTPWAAGVLLANYLAERKAVRFSDGLICLSERDGAQLRGLYGRGATHVSPLAVRDTRPPGGASEPAGSQERFALFVGGTFYANRAGIRWFADRVAPRVSLKVCVVGRGFEAFRDELRRDGKVEVVGAVDDLSAWYRRASFVVAPIFDGSGMKTKVAEALMFGKKVVGTPEAFSGYEDVAERAGWVCRTADDFVSGFRQAEMLPPQAFDPALRALYEERYSYAAARDRLAKIVGSLG